MATPKKNPLPEREDAKPLPRGMKERSNKSLAGISSEKTGKRANLESGNKESIDEVFDRRAKIYEEWLQGYTLREIANKYRYSWEKTRQDLDWMVVEIRKYEKYEDLKEMRERLTNMLLNEIHHSETAELLCHENEDFRAAQAYRKNRLDGISQLAKIYGLEKQVLEHEGFTSLVDLVKKAYTIVEPKLTQE